MYIDNYFFFWQFKTRYAGGLRGNETWRRRNETSKGQEAEKALAAAACIYFCEILETLLQEVLPSEWRIPFMILDLYLGTQGEGMHTVICRLSLEHKVFSNTFQG